MDRGPMITEKDVGSYMIDDRGAIWKVLAYSSHPTYTIESVAHPNTRVVHVVGCPNSSNLTKLKKVGSLS